MTAQKSYPKYTTNTEDIEYDGSARIGEGKIFVESERSITLSEQSYLPLFTSKLVFDITVKLNYSLRWHFYTLLATNIMYFLISYEIVFDSGSQYEMFIILAKVFCNFLLLVDSIITCIYYFSETIKYKVAYGNIDLGLFITQLISLLIVPLQILKYFVFGDALVVDILLITVYVLKYYKLLIYIRLMYSIPGEMTVTNLYCKNFVVMGFFIHSFACIWMQLGCLARPKICEEKFDGPGTYWNEGLHAEMCKLGREDKSKVDVLTPFENYIICLYYVVGGLTHVGFGGSSMRNYGEDLVCIVLMIVYIFGVYGIHCAEMSSYIIHIKTLEFNMMGRKQAMSKDLHAKFIRRSHRNKMLRYYEQFWETDRAVKISPMLQVIPRSLFVDTQTEIFWYFLNKCFFLRSTTASFRRAIASKIKIEVLTKSDVLYELDGVCENVYYIARGNIKIFSSEDGNSTIVTLGKGTCLGQLHLAQRTVTRFKVVLATYSVVYILNKRDFWAEVYKYRKLRLGRTIQTNFKMRIQKANFIKTSHKPADAQLMFRKWKCVVSKKILTGFKETIKQDKRKCNKMGTSDYDDPHKLYINSKILSHRSYDEVFLKTSFPWIFQQNSQFLTIWNFFNLVAILYAAILYPYQVAFKADFHVLAVHVVYAIYFLDVIIQLFTAIDTKLDIINKVEDIVLARIESVKFTLDVVSAFPCYALSSYLNLHGTWQRLFHISILNKLLKLYKINDVFRSLEKNPQINNTFLKSLKNVLYLSYMGYISGCIFYIITCFQAVGCEPTSWIEALYRVMEKEASNIHATIPDLRERPAVFSFLNMLLVLSGTTTAFIVNTTEIGVMIVVALIGAIIMIISFTSLAASVTLSNSAAVDYMEFLNTVEGYMSFIKMNDDLKFRVVRYLENIWMVNKGVVIKDLYYDYPEQLYNENQIIRYKGYLQQTDLFKYTSLDLQNACASRCTELYLPPYEYVIYAGQACVNWYIIIHGYCGILEGLAVQKTLGPGSTVNSMELFLRLPSLMTIRTETHCKILMFAAEDVQYLIKTHPTFVTEILASIDQVAVDRIFSRIGETPSTPKVEKIEDETKSWFKFPSGKRDPLNIDYKQGFQHGRLLKFIVLRRTILPNGRFYKSWELFRAISAVIVSLLSPISFVHSAYFPHIQYMLYVFYAFSIIDIYLKMHLCYYNTSGVLVTHPEFTAVHYFTHSFALDVFSALPFAWLVQFLANTRNCKVEIILHFNVIVQMYRYPNAFATTRTYIYRRDSILITVLKTIPFTLVIINVLSCILLCISGEEVDMNGTTTLKKGNFSWISNVDKIRHIDSNEPWRFYIVGLYFTTTTFTGVSFNLLRPVNVYECVYIVCCVLIGYLLKIYNTVRVAHNRFNVAHKLTQHRNYMIQLSKYMKEEKLPKELQHRVIEHYEHVWRITHSVRPRHIFSMLHSPLKMDVVHFLYRNTLRKVRVFEDANESFYRHFGLGLNEFYMKKNTTVIRLNDIVRRVYIVHRGEAVVLGPDGTMFAILTQGSMFGNLDNVEATRSMVTIFSTSVIDLLVIESSEMYKIFESFEYIYNKLQHYLLLENLSYVVGKKSDSLSDTDFTENNSISNTPSAFGRFLIKLSSSSYMIIVEVLTSVMCCWLVSYQVVFVTPFNFFYVLYLLDIFHVLSIVSLLITPTFDKRSQLISARELFKQNWKSWRWFIDILTILPYDLIGFAFQNSTKIRKYIALYRLLRIIYVYHAFDRSTNVFGAKIIVFRLLKMSIYITLIIHFCACFFYWRACPEQQCRLNTWVYHKGENNCQIPYVCSIYMTLSTVSATGFQNRVPKYKLADMLLCSLLVILGQYLVGSIVGDIIALVRNGMMDLSEYNIELAIFNIYLNNGFVSIPFAANMKKYCISLWTVGNGRQIPTYLETMPRYLLEDLKKFAYGKHIFENVFFQSCHRDFLRLLIAKLNVEYYFSGDVICHQKDINDTMYFIHKGVVDVYSLTHHEELQIDELRDLDSFGIMQGLFPDTPHTHTYKANTVCIILNLKYKDLEQLLTFYPASKFEIYSCMTLLLSDESEKEIPRSKKGVAINPNELEDDEFEDEIFDDLDNIDVER